MLLLVLFIVDIVVVAVDFAVVFVDVVVVVIAVVHVVGGLACRSCRRHLSYSKPPRCC